VFGGSLHALPREKQSRNLEHKIPLKERARTPHVPVDGPQRSVVAPNSHGRLVDRRNEEGNEPRAYLMEEKNRFQRKAREIRSSCFVGNLLSTQNITLLTHLSYLGHFVAPAIRRGLRPIQRLLRFHQIQQRQTRSKDAFSKHGEHLPWSLQYRYL
jgi:hypothetical protein